MLVKQFGSWSAIVTGAILLLQALLFVRGAIQNGTELLLTPSAGLIGIPFFPMIARGAADIGYTLAVIGVIVAAILLLGGLKARTSHRRLWGTLIILGGILTLLFGREGFTTESLTAPHPQPHHFLALAFMLIAGPITTVGGILAVIGAKRGTGSGRLVSSKRGRLTLLFGVTSFLILSVIIIAREPEGVTVRKALEEIAVGRGDLEPLVVTYDDLDGLWGGLRLTIRGTGQVKQRAVGEEVGEPQKVSQEDLVKLAALLIQHTAWEQRVPDRVPGYDESRARLTIQYGQASVTIWEWYNDLEENRRVNEIADFMKKIAWEQPATNGRNGVK